MVAVHVILLVFRLLQCTCEIWSLKN